MAGQLTKKKYLQELKNLILHLFYFHSSRPKSVEPCGDHVLQEEECGDQHLGRIPGGRPEG